MKPNPLTQSIIVVVTPTKTAMWQFCAAIVAFATVPTTQGQQEAFAATLDVENTHEYDCFICTLTVEHAFQKNFTSLLTACESLFGSEDVCRDFDVFHSDFSIDLNQSTLPSAARDVCVAHTRPGTCSDLSLEAWRQSPGYHGQRLTESTGATATTMDVRVSKAYGSRVCFTCFTEKIRQLMNIKKHFKTLSLTIFVLFGDACVMTGIWKSANFYYLRCSS